MLPRTIHHRRRAFTLIELLLVMFILVVLAAIAAPIYFGRAAKSQVDAAKAQISMFETALQNYEGDVHSFPKDLNSLITKPEGVEEWNSNGYIKDLPLDPWKNEYRYKAPGDNGRPYDLWSAGPDKQDGTDDDVTNWNK